MQNSKTDVNKSYSVDAIVAADSSKFNPIDNEGISQSVSSSYANHGTYCNCCSCNKRLNKMAYNATHDELPSMATKTVTDSINVNGMMVGTPNLQEVQVCLHNRDMWDGFSALGTEMIITRIGRRLFPTLDFSVSGLDPDSRYSIKVDVVAADRHRYKYIPASGWVPVQNGTNGSNGTTPANSSTTYFGSYEHPDSPNTGKFWMKNNVITFKKMKLSNDKCCKTKGCIILNSMRKYQPRIIITKIDSSNACSKIVAFPNTRFYAVTSYQNVQVTKKKIQFNPFAKAFRDSNSQVANHCSATNNYNASHLSKSLLGPFREPCLNYPTSGYIPGYPANPYNLDVNRGLGTLTRNNHFTIYPNPPLATQTTRSADATQYYTTSTYSFPSTPNPYIATGLAPEYAYESPVCNHSQVQATDSNRSLNLQLMAGNSRPTYHTYTASATAVPLIAPPNECISRNQEAR